MSSAIVCSWGTTTGDRFGAGSAVIDVARPTLSRTGIAPEAP
jgi:hypothetical protein